MPALGIIHHYMITQIASKSSFGCTRSVAIYILRSSGMRFAAPRALAMVPSSSPPRAPEPPATELQALCFCHGIVSAITNFSSISRPVFTPSCLYIVNSNHRLFFPPPYLSPSRDAFLLCLSLRCVLICQGTADQYLPGHQFAAYYGRSTEQCLLL